MEGIIHELANQVAPLLVQMAGMVLLAVASILLLKLRQIADGHLSVQQKSFLSDLAGTAVHLAEVEGAGKLGSEKAQIARNYVATELGYLGISSVKESDIEATIAGAVQRAWRMEIGPTYHPEGPAPAPAPEPTPEPESTSSDPKVS